MAKKGTSYNPPVKRKIRLKKGTFVPEQLDTCGEYALYI
jgi:hypothetical protein